ncbi:hypothetical protein PFNF135_02411 [Plasmodium falciparum NF135/5.C10]|uniref:Surface antigen n=1 Tax=Plasmodium falciparum NF135/5.C10 TaxID=1036726 RepID=W4IIF7_PLAFA|nr:hypothetical protein PFNF135_02411 [Plasmodium falciparum NF135/5.C10]
MGHYNEVANLTGVIYEKKFYACDAMSTKMFEAVCEPFDMRFDILKADGVTNGVLPKEGVPKVLKGIVEQAEGIAETEAAKVAAAKTATIKATQEKAIEAASGVAPAWGLVSGLGYAAWTHYVTQMAIQKGIEAVISQLEGMPGITNLPGFNLANIINPKNYSSSSLIIRDIDAATRPICDVQANKTHSFCSFASHNGSTIIKQVSGGAESAVTAGEHAVSGEAAKFVPKTTILTNTITTSFIVIVVIVLVMLIIYLILRYRRKKIVYRFRIIHMYLYRNISIQNLVTTRYVVITRYVT